MRKLFAVLVVGAFAATANATNYGDSVGDTFTGAGGGILDIVSAEVTNDASNITFKLTLNNDVNATDWGKYMLALDTPAGSGDPGGNGWGRPISQPSGMNYWLGSWVDSGAGVQTFAYSGSWNMTQANGPFAGPGGTPASSPDVSVSAVGNTVTIVASLASLGLSPGNIVFFDAFTSGGGGGDSAIDSLANPNQSVNDWGVPYSFGPGTNAPELTYLVVPEPATLSLIGLGALALIRRRR